MGFGRSGFPGRYGPSVDQYDDQKERSLGTARYRPSLNSVLLNEYVDICIRNAGQTETNFYTVPSLTIPNIMPPELDPHWADWTLIVCLVRIHHENGDQQSKLGGRDSIGSQRFDVSRHIGAAPVPILVLSSAMTCRNDVPNKICYLTRHHSVGWGRAYSVVSVRGPRRKIFQPREPHGL